MGRFLRMQPNRPDRAAHGYVYYRWTSRYVAVVRYFLERDWLFEPLRTAAGRHLERTHHAKVVPTSDARRLIKIDQPIEYRNLESVVPFAVARDIVLDSPATITLARCACRAVSEQRGTRSAECGPLETCLYIGDPIATFVAEKQPDARVITAEEALAVVSAAAERGDIHTLWFKDAAAGRMYAMCNCCSCCCIGLKSARAGFSPLVGSGYRARVDTHRCTGCGLCTGSCAFDALSISAAGTVVVDTALCLGCGACTARCPEGALSLEDAVDGATPVPWTTGPSQDS
jgi:NAD-dependent dihydropyrimidine dehydrogenase PreA subunit